MADLPDDEEPLPQTVGRPLKLDEPVQIQTVRDGKQVTEEVPRSQAILAELRYGGAVAAACERYGIDESTLRGWKRQGETYEQARQNGARKTVNGERLLLFVRELAEARRGGEAHAVRNIFLAASPRRVVTRKRGTRDVVVNRVTADGTPFQEVVKVAVDEETDREEFDWRANAFMLTHSHGWKSTTATEVSGPAGGPVQVDIQDVEARASAMLERLRQSRGEETAAES